MKLTFFLTILLFFFYKPVFFAQTPLEIWEIQGETDLSPYAGDFVRSSSNIVTAIASDRFYMQTPDDRADMNSKTSNGIMVYMGATPTVQIGDVVTVTGNIKEFDRITEFSSTGLQITVESTGASLPSPVILNEEFPSGTIQTIPDLEQVESMLVEMFDAITTSPSNGNGNTSVTTRSIRSFREAGIEYPGLSSLPEWDGNPEVFIFNPDALGVNGGEELSAGMFIDAIGIMGYDNGSYEFLPKVFTISGNPPLQAVQARADNEVTIGSLNVLLLFADETEYPVRLVKTARYIAELMGAPDIVAIQEAQSLLVMNDIADKVHQLFPNVQYRAFLKTGNGAGSFSINTGFLVRESVQNVVIQQVGKNETLSVGGSLFSRPPLILEGEFATNPPTPISVMNLHLRSLNGIEGNDSFFVRTKRHEQALFVANRVQNMQDDNLVVLGDFNAFQFSDGYVDVVNQIAGTPSLGAQFPVQNIVNPPLTNHSLSVPEEERYSYNFNRNSQILDHCLSNDLENMQVTRLEYARANSDNPDFYLTNPNVLYYTSDHDGLVLFLELEADLLVSNSTPTLQDRQIKVNFPNPFNQEGFINIELQSTDEINMRIYSVNGQVLFNKDLGLLAKGETTITPKITLPDGFYVLEIRGKDFTYSHKLVYKN